LEIATLLAELGFDTPETAAQARAVLETENLTNPRKSRIDASKRPRIEEALDLLFLPTCGAPQCNLSAGGRALVKVADPLHCRICHGSSNARGLHGADLAFQQAGISRVLVVGGSPSVHDELRQKAPKSWDLRIVDGTGKRTMDQARADLKWAQLVLIWGATELDHKVSGLYTRTDDGARDRVVIVNRRGIAALFEAAGERAKQLAARGARSS